MYHHLLHKTPVHINHPSVPHPHFNISRLLRIGVNPLNSVHMDGGGVDSDGREFRSAEEMWREEVGDSDPLKKSQWYSQGVGYWQVYVYTILLFNFFWKIHTPSFYVLEEKGVEATVDGVLGGYGHVNKPDIEGSEAFLNSVLAERFPDAASRGRRLVALDCGSGIGRITKNLLIRYFNEVDLLEPVSHFLDTARRNLAPENLMVTEDYKAVNFFCVPLQEFTPEAERYDIIWIQWCIGHLSDDDFVSFFNRAKGGLRPGGLFILKENIARSGFVLDKEDKSITRSDLYFKQLLNKCGLHIYKMKDQRGFPDELFAVKMYALTTDLPKKAKSSRSKKHINRPGIIK